MTMNRVARVRLGALLGLVLLAACGSERGTRFSEERRDEDPSTDTSPADPAENLARPPTSCTKYEYHPDEDGDGVGHYVRNEEPIVACPEDAPLGYAPTNSDCADRDPRAYYGQRAYFSTPIQGPNVSESAWDFNCNGREEKEPLPRGIWVGKKNAPTHEPNCGETGKWLENADTAPDDAPVDRVQACH